MNIVVVFDFSFAGDGGDEFGNDPLAIRLRDRNAFLGSHSPPPPPKKEEDEEKEKEKEEERSRDSTLVVFNPPTTKSTEAGVCVILVGMRSPLQVYHVKKAVPEVGVQRSDVMKTSRSLVSKEKNGDIITGLYIERVV